VFCEQGKLNYDYVFWNSCITYKWFLVFLHSVQADFRLRNKLQKVPVNWFWFSFFLFFLEIGRSCRWADSCNKPIIKKLPYAEVIFCPVTSIIMFKDCFPSVGRKSLKRLQLFFSGVHGYFVPPVSDFLLA